MIQWFNDSMIRCLNDSTHPQITQIYTDEMKAESTLDLP